MIKLYETVQSKHYEALAFDALVHILLLKLFPEAKNMRSKVICIGENNKITNLNVRSHVQHLCWEHSILEFVQWSELYIQ